ncbi:MAG: globin domain-containing protein [Myxococcota bacterium]
MSDAEQLRDLFEDILATCPSFPGNFYERLFAAHPEVRPMFFRSSPDAQQKMFAQKLVMAIDALDAPERLRTELAGIAATHRSYGVTPEMYGWVGDALVDAVDECAGGRMTPSQRQALVTAWAAMTKLIFEAS